MSPKTRSALALGFAVVQVAASMAIVAGCAAQSLAPEDTADAAPELPDDAKPIPVVTTAYRLSTVTLADPHVFLEAFNNCIDLTSEVNSAISDKLNKDADGDGKLDFSLVMVFKPLDQKPGDMPTGAFVTPSCTAPSTSSTCNGAGANSTSAMVTNMGTGTCLAPVAGTTTASYSPAVVSATAPCFDSASTSYTFTAGGATITLEAAEIGAGYSGTPATSLTHGLMRGFLKESDANALTIDLSSIGDGMVTLSSLLAGGNGSCVTDHSDKDTGPNGEPGWYLYFNFTAVSVPYTD